MSTGNRPLSPHLQVYKLPAAAILSITHRITGVGLTAGLLLLTYWLTAAAYGPEAYATAVDVLGSWFGRLILFGFTLAFTYHLGNGVRHLFWDACVGVTKEDTAKTGMMNIVIALILTALIWIAAYSAGGAS